MISALASLALPRPRQQPLGAVSIRAAGPSAASDIVIACVSVPPYDSPTQDQWCEENNNVGETCGPDETACLSKTCRCGDADDMQIAAGSRKVVCEHYVVREANLAEPWLNDDWCGSYCDKPEGCPPESAEKCMCGPDPAESAAAVPGAVPGEAGAAGKDMLICANDQYVTANEASTDLWCTDSCVPDGCPKDAQEACKCDDDRHEGGGPLSEGDMREVDFSCLSISVDKSNEWCNSECGEMGKCPSDAKKYCRCGDDAVTDDALDRAQKATVARETASNVRRATSSAKSACLARNRVGEDCEQL